MASWPTLKEVRAFLRLQVDVDQDAVIQTALAAAIGAGVKRLGFDITVDPDTLERVYTPRYPPDTDTLPDASHQACVMHAARLYRRRDTVDGTLSVGDLGAIRVGRFDSDIEAGYALDAPLVFG